MSEDANKLCRLKLGMYKAARESDDDFRRHGERAYFGISSWVQFADYIGILAENKRGRGLPPGWSAYELNVLLSPAGDILCLGQLRYGDGHDNITWAGHIGYTVPPSLRGNGYAKEFLRLSLERAWELDFDRAMLTCDLDNHISRHVIESGGGIYAGKYLSAEYQKHQYWFYNPKDSEKE